MSKQNLRALRTAEIKFKEFQNQKECITKTVFEGEEETIIDRRYKMD